jgi:telomerase reverse transcriptase
VLERNHLLLSSSARPRSLTFVDVKTFISGRRFDSLSLHHVLQGIKHTDIAWLGPASQRVVPSDAAKRLALLADFVFWFVDGFVGALLRTTFYATESGAFRNRVLFFRHDDWAALCAPLLERLAAGTFRKLAPVQAQELLRQRRLGFSFVRLLPKETGVRPIVNLRRRRPVQNVGASLVEDDGT